MGNKPARAFREKGISLTAWTTENGGLSWQIRKTFMSKKTNQWEETKYFYDNDLDALERLLAQRHNQQGGVQQKLPIDEGPKTRVQEMQTSFDDDDVPF